MDVAGQGVTARRRLGVMSKYEWRLDERVVDAPKAQGRRRVAGAFVMIAAHENHLDRAMPFAPHLERTERLRRPTFARMQEIAEKDNARRLGAADGLVEPDERAACRSMWHRYAGGAQGSRLPEVRIGYEQRPRSLPERGALGQQVQCLAANGRDTHRDDSAARSNVSCMRRTR